MNIVDVNIADNLSKVHREIANYAKQLFREPPQLIAVSKKCTPAQIIAAYNCGQTDFGENYAQELQLKAQELSSYPINWHFIGPIQSNKIKIIAKYATFVHSLTSYRHAESLNNHRPTTLAPLKVFIEVNISDEPNKHGLTDSAQILELSLNIKTLPNLHLIGLMSMASNNQSETIINQQFVKVASILAQLKQHNLNLSELSLGMSNDYPLAMANGATFLRIGSAIFGART